MSAIMEPPVILDGTRVLLYAETGGAASYTGRVTMHTRSIGAMTELAPVPRLAICEQLANGELMIMHCDETWTVLAAQGTPSIEAAKSITERAYSGITSKWQPYRQLSSEEAAEVAEERALLERLNKEYPIEGDGHAA